MKVSIGIPTYNGAQRLDWLLHSIHAWTSEKCSVAVLDDGTPTLGARQIHGVCEKWKVRLLVHDENRGIAKSWNDLTRFFDSEIMVLLNDDIIVARDWLRCLTYFLENNICGSASLGNYFIKSEDAPRILVGEDVTPRDPFTKQPKPELRGEIREDMTPGIIMCPQGNCFGFTRKMYDLVGGFDDKLFVSFFEESDFGTKLAEKGYKSYGLTYPVCYHVWSQTFRENPELEAGDTMRSSHMNYCRKWNVPEEFSANPFDYTNPKFMSKIPKQKVKWLGKDKKYEAWDK